MSERKIVDYRIILDSYALELEHKVLELLRDGYKLFGHPFQRIIPLNGENFGNEEESRGRSYLYQAMIKYEEE